MPAGEPTPPQKQNVVAVKIIQPIGSTKKIQPKLQSKSATPSTSSVTVKPDAGYDGLSNVTVSAVSRQSKTGYAVCTGSKSVSPDSNYLGLSSVKIEKVTLCKTDYFVPGWFWFGSAYGITNGSGYTGTVYSVTPTTQRIHKSDVESTSTALSATKCNDCYIASSTGSSGNRYGTNTTVYNLSGLNNVAVTGPLIEAIATLTRMKNHTQATVTLTGYAGFVGANSGPPSTEENFDFANCKWGGSGGTTSWTVTITVTNIGFTAKATCNTSTSVNSVFYPNRINSVSSIVVPIVIASENISVSFSGTLNS